MGIATAVLSGFMLAAAAPLIVRLTPRAAGWLLALLPASLFLYFVRTGAALPADGLATGFSWAPSLGLRFSLLLDGLSLLFALLISGVGAVVCVYSQGYMAKHRHLGRFYAFLLTFMASMLGLVLSDNVLTLFVFWELTSFSSYLLIGFENERAEARAAAWQALLVTSGGGLALLAGLLLLGQAGLAAGLERESAFELSALLGLGRTVQQSPLYLPILILIACGAFTKSAQYPFHFWLPNAMEAPTPVSAYLHSATMVKAGVYLLARLNPMLGGSQLWLWILVGFGGVTALVGAALAVGERDLKRMLAYSTVSALGMLVLLIGLPSVPAAGAMATFLLAHALYKGALFLVAGALDHETGTRDVERLGGLIWNMPLTAVAAFVAGLSMAAVPPLFGFIAKELLYEATLDGPAMLLVTGAVVVGSMFFVAVAIMTGVRPFVGRRADRFAEVHEASVSLWLGPALLGILSIAFGIHPALVDERLIGPARAAVLLEAGLPELSLKLWHGWNVALALSGVTLVGGLLLYVVRGPVGKVLAPVSRYGPARLYDRFLTWLAKVAELQTRVLQHGYERYYVLTVVLTTISLVGYAFLRHGVPSLPAWGPIGWFDLGVAIVIPAAILAIVRISSRMSIIVALGAIGYAVALIFALHGAPDLAMSQFLVETLIVVLFVLVFYRLPVRQPTTAAPVRIRDGVISVFFGSMMALLLLVGIHSGGESPAADYFVAHSVPAGHGRNVVNVILVDFRALDTLGEITVLSVAGIGVYALLKLYRKRSANQ